MKEFLELDLLRFRKLFILYWGTVEISPSFSIEMSAKFNLHLHPLKIHTGWNLREHIFSEVEHGAPFIFLCLITDV